MGKRYIDADKLIEYAEKRKLQGVPVDVIKSKETADVEEVRHGKWVLVKPRRNGRNATYKCTVCNRLYSSYYNDVQEWTHCPCGAKMGGMEKEI